MQYLSLCDGFLCTLFINFNMQFSLTRSGKEQSCLWRVFIGGFIWDARSVSTFENVCYSWIVIYNLSWGPKTKHSEKKLNKNPIEWKNMLLLGVLSLDLPKIFYFKKCSNTFNILPYLCVSLLHSFKCYEYIA